MDKEMILIIIGQLLCLTMIGVWIGVPITLVGVYILQKETKEQINKDCHGVDDEKEKALNRTVNLYLITIGVAQILCLTMIGAWIGIPFTLIGVWGVKSGYLKGYKSAEEVRQEKIKKQEEKEQKKLEEDEKNGVTGYDFKCTLHETRQGINSTSTDVIDGYCFVEKDRLVIKKMSMFLKHKKGDKIIPYANINAIDYDQASGFHVTSSIVIAISGFPPILLKHITRENFELVHEAWLKFNNATNTHVVASSADELIKYTELYEKGVLSEEEFNNIKQKIIN